MTAAGVKSFLLNYRVHGRQRRYTIGQMGAWTVETARQEARRLRTLVDRGEDPFAIEQAQKQQAFEEEARQRTFKQLSDYYLSHHAEVHKRPRSVAEDKAMLETIILPRLGRIRVSNITHRDVSELHATLKATPYRANRVLALLHKMFSLAIADTSNEWSIASNPAANVIRFHEEKRERWLSEDELQRLAVALDNTQSSAPLRPMYRKSSESSFVPKRSVPSMRSGSRWLPDAERAKPSRRSGATLIWHGACGQSPAITRSRNGPSTFH